MERGSGAQAGPRDLVSELRGWNAPSLGMLSTREPIDGGLRTCKLHRSLRADPPILRIQRHIEFRRSD